MEFGFLFDPARKLFAIGYSVSDGSLDPNCYDLLASEARLTSFIAIAKGDVAVHTLVPARPRTDAGGSGIGARLVVGLDVRVPDAGLVMRLAAGEPLRPHVPARGAAADRVRAEAGSAVGGLGVRLQRPRPRAHVSVLELRRPGLGLKRGLGEDVVIAPYATALAAMVDPAAAARNFARLAAAGGSGRYGFYEALDYTATRVPEGASVRRRARVHGAPPGHDARRARQRAHGGVDAARASTPSRSSVRPSSCCRSVRRAMSLVARPRAEEVEAASRVRDVVPSGRCGASTRRTTRRLARISSRTGATP